jgi:hypothetical protein
LFPSLSLASGRRTENKKALPINRQGFFFVAEGGLFHDPVWIAAQRKIPASACGVCREFFISSLSHSNFV